MEFIIDLWNSILTPGTSPALIKATHASFAALLLTLIGLLISTRNFHFIILTILASGLWIAITWFISELEALKKQQNISTSTNSTTTKNSVNSSINSSTSSSTNSQSLKSRSKKT
jgi:hypothetical protein